MKKQKLHKKNIKKHGFSLVELLAAIVIFAILSSITVFGVLNLIKSSTNASFTLETQAIIRAVNGKLMEDSNLDLSTINASTVSNILGLSIDNYESLSITMVDNKITAVVIGKNDWAGLKAEGNASNIVVSDYVDSSFLMGFVLKNNGVNVPINEDFSSNSFQYSAHFTGTDDTITITPTAQNENAKIKINNVSVPNNLESFQIPLAPGINDPIEIKVTVDGISHVYKLTVTYEPYVDVLLQTFTFMNGRNSLGFTAPFSSRNFEYTTVSTSALTITATAVAQVPADVNVYINNVLTTSSIITLDRGSYDVYVRVDSKTTSATQTYVFHVNKTS